MIAFDAANNTGAITTASSDLAHTLTGNDLILIVVVAFIAGTGNSKAVFSVKISGFPLIQLLHQNSGSDSQYIDIWYFLNPPSGSQTVTARLLSAPSGTGQWGFGSISLTGVRSESGIEVSGSNTQNVQNPSIAITTVTNNDWITAGCLKYAAALAPTTGTERFNFNLSSGVNTANFSVMTVGPISPPASTTVTWNDSTSSNTLTSVSASAAWVPQNTRPSVTF